MKQKEEWRNIPGYEGYYEVSDFGSIRSISRIVFTNRAKPYKLNGSLLKQINRNSYLAVSLSIKNKKKVFSIHQLVAMGFLGHKKMEIKNNN